MTEIIRNSIKMNIFLAGNSERIDEHGVHSFNGSLQVTRRSTIYG